MTLQELKEASLHRIIETTLEEYAIACETTPHRNYFGSGYNYHPDKCGYIGQILGKVEDEKQRSEGEQ